MRFEAAVTCGTVRTLDKFEHAFGYYVCRAKMPKQPGHWPAFWMMGAGVGKVGNDGRDGTEIVGVQSDRCKRRPRGLQLAY